jgi:putative ABC transport system substrate-binding protein
VKRRELITLLGGAAVAWPLAARAQQPVMPVIGFIGFGSFDTFPLYLAAFRNGLKEIDFVEGQNVAIEYRWAEGQYDRMPELAAELIRRRVAVIAMPGSPPAAVRAVKTANSATPIVFSIGGDPVKFGLVPSAARIAVLVNPADPERAEAVANEAHAAARTPAVQIQLLKASTSSEIDAAFASLERFDALLVGPDGFFNTRRVQLALLAARYAIPTNYAAREYADAGGLMSYGTSLADMYRQVGLYTGRILKGAKPADLPVIQSTKFELVINLQTAKLLGLSVPPTLLARADEVIE